MKHGKVSKRRSGRKTHRNLTKRGGAGWSPFQKPSAEEKFRPEMDREVARIGDLLKSQSIEYKHRVVDEDKARTNLATAEKNTLTSKATLDATISIFYKTRSLRHGEYDEKIQKHLAAESILKANFTKLNLHTLLIVTSCVMFNVHVVGDPKVVLYREELLTLIERLEDIFKKHCRILNDYFGTDIFNENMELTNITQTDGPTIKQDRPENTNNTTVLKSKIQEEFSQNGVIETELQKTVKIADQESQVEESSNSNIPVLTNAPIPNNEISRLMDEVSQQMTTMELMIPTSLSPKLFIFSTDINFFLRFVIFLSKFINKLKEKIELIAQADANGVIIIQQSRVVLAKSKMWHELKGLITAPYNIVKYISERGSAAVNPYAGGGFMDRAKRFGQSAVDTAKTLPGRALDRGYLGLYQFAQFFSKADESVKQKYSFLLYYNTFLTMYDDNSFINRELSTNSTTTLSYLYDLTAIPYRYTNKNPIFGSFFMILTAAVQIVFWGQFVCPPLAIAAEPMMIAQKTVGLVLLPFIDEPKQAIFKEVQIEERNNAIKTHNMNNKLINEISDKYVDLLQKILKDSFNFKLSEKTATSPIDQATTTEQVGDTMPVNDAPNIEQAGNPDKNGYSAAPRVLGQGGRKRTRKIRRQYKK